MASNHRIFALKKVVIPQTERYTIEQYRNEVQLLLKLKNNNRIIQLWDFEIIDHKGIINLLMECGEIDLAHLMEKRRTEPFDIHFIGFYWRQILEAVDTIHNVKIVHSDLKPANFVLVSGSLKLIDFGIAKAISNDTTNIHRENCMGTISYMSPEAIVSNPASGVRKVGKPSDVWSLGCILYQMVYGKTLFHECTNQYQRMGMITDHTHVIVFPSTTLSPFTIKSTSLPGPSPKGALPDPALARFETNDGGMLSPPPISVPQEQQQQQQQISVRVDPNLIRIMSGCLAREPKDRLTILQLLGDPFINVSS
ncbi:Dual-specificity kinase, spindle pole body (SPB) duplication and spindle checkpoint function [Podila humilis]|nr:Dual-specificity kinase, spindle pole body (SPB) duplication and spindle checkpoint function [Podila humilis]